MIVSWNWLKDYVQLDFESAELEHRLSMAGLNHEGTKLVGDDLAIDLEVTSNRPDWLGHLGVAREIGVLWNQPVNMPDPQPKSAKTPVSELCKVSIDCPELCYRYTARVIRGVKVGPSPDWLTNRLTTIGVASINNIVDITNFVLFESGQPLHAFDFDLIRGRQIIVRAAGDKEQFEAIDHRTYSLTPEMCVIADSERAVALGGVMGGVDSEVSETSKNVLVESAEFAPLSIRTTARALNLHSPSSYRFERRVDPEGIDWASRRCCELILDLAGGELAEGVVDVAAQTAADRQTIVLRLSQLPRILGIEVDREQVRRILTDLGNKEVSADPSKVEFVPPSWRRDLTREIDLIEEVARIHGYEQIPEDASVPMVASHRTDAERVMDRVRHCLTGAGLTEALTASGVSQDWSAAFSPWSNEDALACTTAMLRGADRLRRSLIPSLLGVRRTNESIGNFDIELFETAKVYLPRQDKLPNERWIVAITSGSDFFQVKGIVERLVQSLNPNVDLNAVDVQLPLLDLNKSCELELEGEACGYLAEISDDGLRQFGLKSQTTVAEIDFASLHRIAELVPQYEQQPSFPGISQDLNLILDESVRWTDLASTVRDSAGPLLASLEFREIYRDADRDGPDKKRLLFAFTLRASDRTLVAEEADAIRQSILDACDRRHKARLLG